MPITIGAIKKYNYDYAGDYKEVTLSAADLTNLKTARGKPTHTAASATESKCDNFVLEYQLRIQYKPYAEATEAQFSIEKATLDLVYGTITAAPTEEPRIARLSQVTFYQTDESRMSSGTPGYLKEYPVRTATKVIRDTGKDYMRELKDGFYFRGADNFGKCI